MAGEQRILLRRGTSAEWDTADPTLSAGELGVDTTLGMVKLGDGSATWSALQFLRDGSNYATTSVSADYTITGAGDRIVFVTTGATDRTITLPAGSGAAAGEPIEVYKVDAGAGKVTIQRAGADTIDGVTSVDVDSDGDLVKVRWTGTKWTVTEYKDHGSNANGEWVRYADGTMQVSHNLTITAYPTTWTFPAVFASLPRRTIAGAQSDIITAAVNVLINPTLVTSADVYLRNVETSTNVTTGAANVFITGRWRA